LCCFSIIGLFAVGAVAGSCLLEVFGLKAIWVSCLLLSISFAVMFVEEIPIPSFNS
jgi:uncharacterized membrane protein YoaK (UPF0700 family)